MHVKSDWLRLGKSVANRKLPSVAWHRRMRPLTFERCESREMLASDLQLTSFASDGLDFVVTYDIANEGVAPFDITVYRSADGTTLGDMLATVEVADSAKRIVGNGHSVSISPAFTDVASDYKLVAVVDAGQEISETSETNNQGAFAGGVFKTADGTVHVHGTAAGDTIVVSQPSAVDVVFNSLAYSFAANGVAAVRLRTHGGNDAASSSLGSDKSLWMFGGDGNDTFNGGDGDDVFYGSYGGDVAYGGNGADTLRGENGNDMIDGGGGNDELYAGLNDASGGYGDTVNGGSGNDALYGDGGADLLRGDDGNDTIACGSGNDVAHGGDGDDIIIGGHGDDAIYGEAGNDSLYGDQGNDSLYGGDGSDAGYGSYGELIDGGIGIDLIVAVEGTDIKDRPTFVTFECFVVGGILTIRGRLADDGNLAGRTVRISGAYSGTASVSANGEFSWSTGLAGSGYVNVDFTDEEGLDAETKVALV